MSNEFEHRLEEAVARLPREREPAADLWPGIESRLGRRRSRAVPASLAAALACGLALALWFGTGSRSPAPVEHGRPASALAGAGFPRHEALLREAALVDQSYRAAMLVPRAAPRQLNRSERLALNAELDVLEDAQGRIRAAMHVQPDGEYLLSLLAQTHALRLDLINRLAGGPAHPGGNDENGNV